VAKTRLLSRGSIGGRLQDLFRTVREIVKGRRTSRNAPVPNHHRRITIAELTFEPGQDTEPEEKTAKAVNAPKQ
jgi:hypothetical protein